MRLAMTYKRGSLFPAQQIATAYEVFLEF